MVIAHAEFGTPMGFFFRTALESIQMRDFMSGFGKSPFFGVMVAIIGCYYGLAPAAAPRASDGPPPAPWSSPRCPCSWPTSSSQALPRGMSAHRTARAPWSWSRSRS